MDEKREITNFKELSEEFAEKKDKILKDSQELIGLIPEIPKLAKEMAKRGLDEKRQQIDADFKDINLQKVQNQIEIGMAAGLRNRNNQEWQKENANRSKVAKNMVSNVHEKSVDIRSKMANGALKVTSVVGKGLALFGKKGLAQQMSNKVTEKGKNFIVKESRIGKFMERAFSKGFVITDSIRRAKQSTIEFGKKAKDKVVDVAEAAWVIGDDVKKGIKKGAEDVIIGTAAGIESGVLKAKQVGKNIKYKAEDVILDSAIAAEAGIKKAKEVGENVKDGAVKVGKAAAHGGYQIVLGAGVATVGVAAGIAAIGIIGGKVAIKGAQFVGEKAKDTYEVAKDFTIEKAGQAKEFATDKIETAKDYKDLAKGKMLNTKARMGVGIKSFITRAAQSVIDKITPSLVKSQEKVNETEQSIAASRNKIGEKKIKESGEMEMGM